VQMDTPTKPLAATADPLWKQWYNQYFNQGDHINTVVLPLFRGASFCQCCGAATIHPDGTTSHLTWDNPPRPYTVEALKLINKDGIYFGNGATTEKVIQLARLTGDLDGLEIQDGDRLYSFVWRDH
jgi:hypothetical protein